MMVPNGMLETGEWEAEEHQDLHKADSGAKWVQETKLYLLSGEVRIYLHIKDSRKIFSKILNNFG